jgi:predicted Zn-dependent protease
VKARLASLLVLGGLGLGGCVYATTPADERRAGAEMAQKVETRIGLYRAPAKAWVSAVGERLVGRLDPDERSDWNFDFDVVDQVEPNAFALPGGPIYVSRGLLALVTNEDELACVLGHEITHVTQRHATARAEKGFLPSLLTVPGRLVGVLSPALGNVVAAPFEVLGDLRLAHYSREQESEADRVGARLAASAGYDPRALATILDRLEKDATRLAGSEREPSFFDDHPSTPSRVADVNHEAATIVRVARPPMKSWPEILATLDGLPWGENPARGVFRRELFLDPDEGFVLGFPAGWRTVVTPVLAGATRADQAVVAIAVAGIDADPETAAKAFVARLRRDGTEPIEDRPIEGHGFPGHLVGVADPDSDMLGYLAWVRMGTLTRRLIGIGHRSDRPAIMTTIESLRPITEEERASIQIVRVRSARAAEGESLARLRERSGDVWPVTYTALLNGRDEGSPLLAGQLVKIGVREVYVPAERAP